MLLRMSQMADLVGVTVRMDRVVVLSCERKWNPRRRGDSGEDEDEEE